MIGFVRRHGNDAKIVKDFADTGYFGDLYYAKATYLRRNGNPGGWFGDKSRSGGGPLIDLGVHVIDLVRYLIGLPKPVSVFGATFHKLGNRPDVKGTKAYLLARLAGRMPDPPPPPKKEKFEADPGAAIDDVGNEFGGLQLDEDAHTVTKLSGADEWRDVPSVRPPAASAVPQSAKTGLPSTVKRGEPPTMATPVLEGFSQPGIRRRRT